MNRYDVSLREKGVDLNKDIRQHFIKEDVSLREKGVDLNILDKVPFLIVSVSLREKGVDLNAATHQYGDERTSPFVRREWI